MFFFFFFKQKTAYEIYYGLVGSEMFIRDRLLLVLPLPRLTAPVSKIIAALPLSFILAKMCCACLLYTSDAADERSSVDLGGRRIIKKKQRITITSGLFTDIQQYRRRLGD